MHTKCQARAGVCVCGLICVVVLHSSTALSKPAHIAKDRDEPRAGTCGQERRCAEKWAVRTHLLLLRNSIPVVEERARVRLGHVATTGSQVGFDSWQLAA